MGRRRSRNTARTGDRALYRGGGGGDDDKIGGAGAGRGDDDDDDDDPVHDEVDRYHLSRARREEEEVIRLDGGDDEDAGEGDDDDGIVKNREGVFDLGVGASSSSSSSDDDESDDGDDESSDEEGVRGAGNEGRRRRKADGDPSPPSSSAPLSSSDDDDSSSDSDDSDDEDDDGQPATIGSVLDWGRSKKSYYQTGGDTNLKLRPGAAMAGYSDDDDAEEKDDAILEEEAGREVQRLRLRDMDEDDFLEDFGGDGGGGRAAGDEGEVPPSKKRKKASTSAGVGGGGLFEALDGLVANDDDVDVMDSTTANLAGMTREERLERLASAHPEFLPLVRHFADSALSPLAAGGPVSVASRHLLSPDEGGGSTGDGDGNGQAEAVGATPGGLEYLRAKRLVLVSTVLNLVSYLLLKRDSVRNKGDGNGGDGLDMRSHPVIARLNELQGLNDALREGVEVPFGLDGQLDSLRKAAELMMDEGNDAEAGGGGGGSSSSSSEEEDSDESSSGGPRGTKEVATPARAERGGGAVSSSSSSDEEVDAPNESSGGAAAAAALNEARFAVRWGEDFDEGGEGDDDDGDGNKKKKRRRRTTAEKRRGMGGGGGGGEGDYGDEEYEDGGEDAALRASRALSATVNSIAQREKTRNRRRRAAPDAAGGGDADAGTNEERFGGAAGGLDAMEEEMLGKAGEDDDDDVDRELVEDVSEDDAYYNAVKKRAGDKRAGKRAKYAVAPKYPSIEGEVRGERAASKTIMKNRGLVPHKNRLSRNPRVKKREQYRKALVRRRGAVRELRKPEEGERYGGEVTGIKTGLSRSRKLGVR